MIRRQHHAKSSIKLLVFQIGTTIIDDVNINPKDLSAASLYGKGVFTTIAIYRSTPFLWEKHWRRLSDNAERLGIDLQDLSEETVRRALTGAIEDRGIVDGRARMTFQDDRPSEIWPSEDDASGAATMSIIVAEFRPVPRPFRCFVSPHTVNSRSPLVGVKSCNYLENILSIGDAKKRGFDEAIRLNENGIVTSACMANVFWLKEGRLFTPSLSTGCLPGTTREFVLENIECDEVEMTTEEVRKADAIFLTSAGLGVVAVEEFDGRQLDHVDHSVLRLI
jgi:branched-subunit amino acid aminotransferase/4-amino-4-deoxychorismate lyase